MLFDFEQPEGRSKRQATGAHPMTRKHLAGLLAAGAVVATSAFAIPVLTQAGDAPTADASATIPTSTTTTAIPTTTDPTTAPTTTAVPTTTPAAPVVDPAAAFAASYSTFTPEQQLAFTLYTATPEERAAFYAFIAPPPPAPEPAPEPEPAPAPAPVATAPAPGGFLACVRQRESHGQYAINTGNGYYGAYQFSQSTWNNTAAHAGRGDLVGVRPSSVSPADQDAMAVHLYGWQGRSPWAGPGC